MNDPLGARRALDFSKELAALGGRYHSFELPDGTVLEGYSPLSVLRQRYAAFGLPDDLRGKRALDVGAADGWFSFELERRGADVVAVDVHDVPTLRLVREMLGSKVRYEVSSVYDLRRLGLGKFDIVLFQGVLYHLRHPLLALEIICELCGDLLLLDSFVVDGDEAGHIASPIPWMEFYETDELGGHADNWCGPSVACLVAMIRAAGFVRPEIVDVQHRHAQVRGYRRWEPATGSDVPAPELRAVLHNRSYGINFTTGSEEEYMACWFYATEPDLTREDMRVEAGGYGCNTVFLKEDAPGAWFLNCQFPRGLAPGRHDVKLRTRNSPFSGTRQVALDLEAV